MKIETQDLAGAEIENGRGNMTIGSLGWMVSGDINGVEILIEDGSNLSISIEISNDQARGLAALLTAASVTVR